MDFFARQERSRRTSRYLIGAFALAFAAVVLATTVVAAFVLRLYGPRDMPLAMSADIGEFLAQNAGPLGLVAAGTLLLMTLASLYRAATLARGGGQVARMMGGTEVTGDVTDFARKRLMNVVEEMSIASGVPVPDVYVLEQEEGINAFAAGLTPSDAAIAVTRGALERLDRAELQGVIAHEFSHVLNGDTRLNQQLIGLSFGILVVSLIGRWLLRAARFGRRGRNSGGTAAAVGLGAALALIGGVGLLLSRLIKAGVSRERERLADASAVQFTREPQGLASALKKIGGHTSQLRSIETEEVAHMLFGRGSRAFRGWFATHPPLEERIRALDPSFDASELAAAAAATPAAAAVPAAAATAAVPAAEAAAATAAAAPGGAVAVAGAHAPDADGAALLEHAGEVGRPDVGAGLLAAVPEEITAAARSHDSSLLLMLALALSAQPRTRAAQRALLEAQLGNRRTARCITLADEIAGVDAMLRMPILELAVPALRQRPAEQLDYLLDMVTRLVDLDGERTLFDYVLLRMLAAYLTELPERSLAHVESAKLSVSQACEMLLASVAAFGHDDPAEAHAALEAGLAALGATRRADTRASIDAARAFIHAARDLGRLDAALERLARLAPRKKRTLLNAVLATIRHDTRLGVEELELFRAIAATLGIPLPPFAGIAQRAATAATRAAGASAAERRR